MLIPNATALNGWMITQHYILVFLNSINICVHRKFVTHSSTDYPMENLQQLSNELSNLMNQVEGMAGDRREDGKLMAILKVQREEDREALNLCKRQQEDDRETILQLKRQREEDRDALNTFRRQWEEDRETIREFKRQREEDREALNNFRIQWEQDQERMGEFQTALGELREERELEEQRRI